MKRVDAVVDLPTFVELCFATKRRRTKIMMMMALDYHSALHFKISGLTLHSESTHTHALRLLISFDVAFIFCLSCFWSLGARRSSKNDCYAN